MPHVESQDLKTAYFSGVELNLALVDIFFRFGSCLWLWSRSDILICCFDCKNLHVVHQFVKKLRGAVHPVMSSHSSPDKTNTYIHCIYEQVLGIDNGLEINSRR